MVDLRLGIVLGSNFALAFEAVVRSMDLNTSFGAAFGLGLGIDPASRKVGHSAGAFQGVGGAGGAGRRATAFARMRAILVRSLANLWSQASSFDGMSYAVFTHWNRVLAWSS